MHDVLFLKDLHLDEKMIHKDSVLGRVEVLGIGVILLVLPMSYWGPLEGDFSNTEAVYVLTYANICYQSLEFCPRINDWKRFMNGILFF